MQRPIFLDLPMHDLLDAVRNAESVLDVNASLSEMFGAEPVEFFIEQIEISGESYTEALLLDDEQTLRDLKTSDFRLSNVEFEQDCADGMTKYFVADIFGVVVDDKLQAVYSMLRDVTAQRFSSMVNAENNRREGEQSKQDALDSLGEHIAILDRNGNILSVNEAWRKFARENGASNNPRSYGIGTNYLDICEVSNGERGSESRKVYEGIRAVLDGELKLFTLEYPCHTPKYDAWFLMTVAPLTNGNGAVVSHFDISKRKQIELDLQESRSQFQYLTENINSVFWIYSWNEKKTEYLSPPFERLWGYERENIISHHEKWIDIVHVDDREAYLNAFDNLEASGKYEIEYRIKDSKEKICWIYDKGFFVKDGDFSRAIGVCEDISERKNLELEREKLFIQEQKSRAEAEKANRLKDEFLATVSHELRTPLTSIVGWTQMILSGRLDEDTARHGLETIRRNADSQVQLIEDLLDVSHITNKTVKLELQPILLLNVIEVAIETNKPSAKIKNININLHADSSNASINADSVRIKQILCNLLSNAVKFTQKNGEINVFLREIDSQIEIKVQDNGIGIKKDVLPHIFEHFRQADGTTTRRFGGLGLGLSIVRHLTEMHGGSIEAKSDGENQGAIFIAKFPKIDFAHNSSIARLGNADSIEIGEIDKQLISHHFDNVKLLVVDDDGDNLNLLRLLFEKLGAVVETAETAKEALEKFQIDPPDILISDVGISEENGYSLIKKIRDDKKVQVSKPIPAIALAALNGNEDVRRSLESGFQRHLLKPVEPDELVRKVAELLRLQS